MSLSHNPVLLNSVIEGLNIIPNGTYIDCTFGRGGHSKNILEKIGNKGKLIAIDKDGEAESYALSNFKNDHVNKSEKMEKDHLILLESLISDGIEIKKKYKNMFKFDQSLIPTDLQMLLNNNQAGMILLRLVEIIGEDDLENLDADTLYFMTSILNELDLDSIRNKLLLEVLPLKI